MISCLFKTSDDFDIFDTIDLCSDFELQNHSKSFKISIPTLK